MCHQESQEKGRGEKRKILTARKDLSLSLSLSRNKRKEGKSLSRRKGKFTAKNRDTG